RDAGGRDARGPVRDDRPGARDRRIPRRQEGGGARTGDAADHGPAVRGPRRRGDPDRGRPDVLPRAEPGSNRRACPRGLRKGVLSMGDRSIRAVSAWEGRLLKAALLDSLRKLDPRAMVRNPVMFVVEVGSVLTTLVWIRDLVASPAGAHPAWF